MNITYNYSSFILYCGVRTYVHIYTCTDCRDKVVAAMHFEY